jgi:hypothetical protein
MLFLDFLALTRLRYYKFRRPRVLGRFACLGDELVSRLKPIQGASNHQKSRVDYLIHSAENRRIVCKPDRVIPHLDKKYVQGTIEQQAHNFLAYAKPDFIMLDSFSELSDQLFEHKTEGWQFCANYTDINHSPEFEAEFDKHGLMPVEEIEKYYRVWFDRLRRNYGMVPIIFIHFPTLLDNREKFKQRGQAILEIMGRVEKEYENIFSVYIEDEYVDWPRNESNELKGFPYHYDVKTYAAFIAAINKLGLDLQ